jgi:hypothetical protein
MIILITAFFAMILGSFVLGYRLGHSIGKHDAIELLPLTNGEKALKRKGI